MNKIKIFIILAVLGTACSQPDKQAELAKLRKQHDELAVKIKELESQLNDNSTVKEANLVNVVATEMVASAFNHFIEVQGRVDGEENIAVSAQMPGAITAVYVKEGQTVRKGQVLAQTDNSVLMQQLANLEQQLDFVTNLYNKQKALWDQKIGSEVQYLTSKNNKESLEKNLAALKDQIEMTKIKSPINGSVEEINLRVGQMASPGLPAVRVVNFSSVKVVADIAEAYSSAVKTGDRVNVYFPDLKMEETSTIHFTSKFINPVNRTFSTEVKLSKGEVEYRANMIAVVKINDYNNPLAISTPVNLIRETPSGKYLFVVRNENGKWIAHRQAVTVGSVYNGLAEITSGVQAGDKIVTTGYNSLTEGQHVQLN